MISGDCAATLGNSPGLLTTKQLLMPDAIWGDRAIKGQDCARFCAQITLKRAIIRPVTPSGSGGEGSSFFQRNETPMRLGYFLKSRVLVRLINASTSLGSKRSCFPIRWASIFPSRTSLHNVVLETLSRSTTSRRLNSFSCFGAIGFIVTRPVAQSMTI